MTLLVSVVVCVRDGLPYLGSALDSISLQEHPDVEVVVVDDGSRDGSSELLQARGLDPVVLDGVGTAAARNAGLARAQGEFVCFLDQDDELLPDKLSRQVALLEQAPSTDVVAGRMVAFLEPGVERPPWLPDDWFGVPRFGPILGTMLIRRHTFAAAGTFDSHAGLTDDLDWLLRAGEAGLVVSRHDDVVLRYRIHDRNQSHRRETLRADAFRVLRRSIARRRGD